MPHLPLVMRCIAILVMFLGLTGAMNRASAQDASSPDAPAPTELEDAPSRLEPQRVASEAETDRMEALALFATGRGLQQSDDPAAALRYFQRAYRRDPQALNVLQEIVQLAFSMGRSAEAVRYAVQLAAFDSADPTLLQNLAAHLMTQGDFAGALKLFERLKAVRPADDRSAGHVMLMAEMCELQFVTGKKFEAADSAAAVLAALQEPGKHGLNSRQRKQLLGDEPADTFQRLGDILLADGRTDEAEEAYRKGEEQASKPQRLGYNMARVAWKRNQPAEALESLQAYFKAHAALDGTAPYALLSDLLTALGREGELFTELERLHADDPENAPLGYYLAERYVQANRADDAAILYQKLIVQRPTVEGFRALAKLLREKPDDENLLDHLGTCVEQGGDLDPLGDERSAILENADLVDRLIAAARTRHEAGKLTHHQSLAIGELAIEAKRADDAETFYRLAAEKSTADDLPLTYLRWGFAMLAGDQYDRAVNVFQEAIDKKVGPAEGPDFPYHMAGALEMAGRTDEALKAVRQAIQVAEQNPETMGDKLFRIYPRLPWILYHAKRYDEAETAYQELINRFGTVYNSSAARDAVKEARFAMSNVNIELGRLADAEECLEQVLDEYPDDVGAQNDLGYLWVDQGKHVERSLKMIQRAVAAKPENAAYRDSLGWALYRLGKFDEAVAELETAAKVDNPDGVILDHLGDAYHAAKKSDEAIKAWQRAIEAFERDKEPAKKEATQKKLDEAKNKASANRSHTTERSSAAA